MIISLQTSNTNNAIISYPTLQNKNVHEDQTIAEHPTQRNSWPSDDLCHQCACVKMSATLGPCCHAAHCRGCADNVMQWRKTCPFCSQHATDVRDIPPDRKSRSIL